MNDVIQHRDERTATTAFKQFASPCKGRLPCAASCSNMAEHRELMLMQQAFHRTGGLVSGDEATRLLRRQSAQPISTLARWIVGRTIVNFEWQSQTLVPLFQFDPADMSLSANTVVVIGELIDVFDDWELAVWFAQPNIWLQDGAPCEQLATNTAAVIQAARADRFIARG